MKRVLLDCDGVLAATPEYLRDEIRSHGLPVPDKFVRFDMWSQMPEASSDLGISLFKDSLFWANIPPYEEAKAVVHQLQELGCDVICVTAPWTSCSEWEFARRSWLKRHFNIPHTNMIPFARKEVIPGDIFIDDKVETVEKWTATWPKSRAFVMTRSWNENEETACQRISWDPAGVETLLSAVRAS